MNQDDYLFVKEDGKPYSSSKAFGKVVSKASKRVGLNYSCHAMRRKCAQDLVFKHKIALPLVAEHLGHSPRDIETLMISYCLIPPNASIDAVKNIIE
jgi:integrase